MSIYTALVELFPQDGKQSRLLRGALLVHHGKNDYQEVFEQIKHIYRHHLIELEYRQTPKLHPLKLSRSSQQKLKKLTKLPQGRDLAEYAKFLLFDFHG